VTDPRTAAERWLAEQWYIAWGTQSWPRPAPAWADLDEAVRDDYLAAAKAVLSAPGVEVERDRLCAGVRLEPFARDAWATHTQVVIRLPAQPTTPEE
jgi:hypothetical protein